MTDIKMRAAARPRNSAGTLPATKIVDVEVNERWITASFTDGRRISLPRFVGEPAGPQSR